MLDGDSSSSSSDERSLRPGPPPPSPSFGPLPRLAQLLERHASISTPTTAAAYLACGFPVSAAPTAAANGRKRSLDELHGDEDEDEDDDAALAHTLSASGDGTKPRRAGKWRKPTYLIRKEEKEDLLHEIRSLQDQVAFLRQRFGMDERQLQDRQLVEKEMTNHELRKSVRGHHFQVLAAQSAVCELTTKLHSECPIDTFIHLGREWNQRNETLMSLKEPQLRQATELLERRTQFFSEPREYVENSQFLSDSGDFCSIRFDVTPLEGLHSVKDAFELLHFIIRHMQSRASPQNGAKFSSIDQMAPDASIVQRRLVLSQTEDIATEANFVMFSELRRSDRSRKRHTSCSAPVGTSDLGLLVLNFVDQDELYPYDPSSYVQHDLSGVMAFEACKRRVVTPSGAEKDETVVVLTRWVLQKLRRSDQHVPSHLMQAMRERVNEPANAILAALKEARHPLELDKRAVPYLW